MEIYLQIFKSSSFSSPFSVFFASVWAFKSGCLKPWSVAFASGSVSCKSVGICPCFVIHGIGATKQRLGVFVHRIQNQRNSTTPEQPFLGSLREELSSHLDAQTHNLASLPCLVIATFSDGKVICPVIAKSKTCPK